MSNKLGYVGVIIEIIKIPEYDNIVGVKVDCGKGGIWHGVIRRNLFNVGDKVFVFLPDSILPQTEEFKYCEKFKYRVKKIGFKGFISEVLVHNKEVPNFLNVGDDVTEYFGIKKYQKPLPLGIQGEVKGDFPSFLYKTDEIYYEKFVDEFDKLNNLILYIRKKLDGSSITCYFYNGEFGVCSRNNELKINEANKEKNVFVNTAIKEKIHEKLAAVGKNIAIQGELMGPKIQGNPLKLNEHTIFVFDIFDIDKREYLSCPAFSFLAKDLDFKVPDLIFIGELFNGSEDIDKKIKILYDFARCDRNIEGIVVRGDNIRFDNPDYPRHLNRISFKVINPDYRNQ